MSVVLCSLWEEGMSKRTEQVIANSDATNFMQRNHCMIPDAFQQTVLNVHGKAGKLWLNQLPSLLKSLTNKLHCKIEKSCTNLSFNFVALVVLQDGSKEFTTEISALESYAGEGAVKLFAVDAKKGWLFEERCVPGKNLLSLKDDEKATTIALGVMQQLWRPVKPQAKFPTLTEWLRGLDKFQKYSKLNPGVFPKKLIDFALKTSKELLASSGEQVLLHGDLHHFNILSSVHNSWLAIDPKGVIGEREYEICAFMRNPGPQLFTVMDTKKVLLRRFDQIVEHTGFDRERILLWSIVNAVLVAWWCIEDNIPGKDYLLNYVQILHELYGRKT
jgi:streptomycin 6-kinase